MQLRCYHLHVGVRLPLVVPILIQLVDAVLGGWGFMRLGLEIRVKGLRLRVSGFGWRGLGLRVQGLGFEVGIEGLGFSDWGVRFGIEG